MKKIIERGLDLKVKYSLVGVSYIPVMDSGTCCDNCGKPISNIAEVKSEKGNYHIGLDCLETVLINSEMLDSESYLQYMYSDKPAISRAKSLRAKILKGKKENPDYTAKLAKLENKFGFEFYIKDGSSINGVKYDKPMGWDYRFEYKYFDLTIGYVKGLFIESEK